MLKTNYNFTGIYITQKPLNKTESSQTATSTNKDTASFKGHLGAEKIIKDVATGDVAWLRHETALFRDSTINNFVKDYIFKNFLYKDKIKVVVGGCSSGEEAVTQSMMLKDIKNKVDILAFDLSEQSINEAKSRKYLFQRKQPAPKGYHDVSLNTCVAFDDSYLWDQTAHELTTEQKTNKKLFEEFFEPTNEIVPPATKTLTQRYQDWVMKKLFKIWPVQIEGQYFKLRKNKADNIDFVQGNILNVDEVMNGKKADVFFFRNALYHLVTEDIPGGWRCIKPDAQETITHIVSQVKNNLNPKGIFVLGQNEYLQVLDYDTLPQILKKFGFKPICNIEGVETVWQK